MLLDADVVLDTAQGRQPFAADSDRGIQWCQETPQAAMVAWHSISNLYCLLSLARDDAKPREFIAICCVSCWSRAGVAMRFDMHWPLPLRDFEDALQVAVAISGGADVIVSRNIRDFRRSPLPAATPSNFLRRIRSP